MVGSVLLGHIWRAPWTNPLGRLLFRRRVRGLHSIVRSSFRALVSLVRRQCAWFVAAAALASRPDQWQSARYRDGPVQLLVVLYQTLVQHCARRGLALLARR